MTGHSGEFQQTKSSNNQDIKSPDQGADAWKVHEQPVGKGDKRLAEACWAKKDNLAESVWHRGVNIQAVLDYWAATAGHGCGKQNMQQLIIKLELEAYVFTVGALW